MTKDSKDDAPQNRQNKDDISDFNRRLKDARHDAGLDQTPEEQTSAGSGLGMALRIATELVAAVVVGAGMGWYLDKWLGTKPWLFVLFLFFGVAAGFLNVIRTAKSMSS